MDGAESQGRFDCPRVSGSHDAWPPDFDANEVINIVDVFKVFPPVFGSSTGSPDSNGDTIPDYSARADLVPDGVINTEDVFKLLPPTFGSNCMS